MLKNLLKKEVNIKSFGDLFFALWILTVLIFSILTYLASQMNFPEKLYYFMDIDFLAGIAFFVVAVMLKLIEILNKRFKKQKANKDKLKSSDPPLNKRFLKYLKNVLFVLWNMCIIVFSLTVIFEDYFKDRFSFDTGSIIGSSLVIGIFFFLSFALSYLFYRDTLNPKLRLRDIVYVAIPSLILLTSLIGFSVTTKYRSQIKKISNLEKQLERNISNDVSNTQPVTVVQPKVIDADPMVNCNVHDNCGGGTRYIKKSVCENSTCCKVGDDWIFYFSKDECNKDQKEYREDLLKKMQEDDDKDDYIYDYNPPTYEPPTYDPPVYTPPPTYTPPVYTPPQKTEEEIAMEIEECKAEVREKYSQLFKQCNFGDSSATEMCIYAVNKELEKELKACEY